ncbi:dihydrofolate reductase family protein [Streptomyces bohaiensis]|uniref:Dihydrofolate reductase n=1 Tax=Streptomyces bohaiensis TaxID=1431344 RepID=A0ABX1CCX6_9ACTN|nr:dihydrofolate reductase family protein [Streptomyces bohaiensis]NJQ15067.1 dihydrofolate reductase [Streptomyces bohaiensis]
MAGLLYSVSMSLDGFIAGPGGDLSWLTPLLPPPGGEPNPLTEEIGALLIGRRTFGGDDAYRDTEGEGEAFGGGWSGPQIVLTRRPPPAPVPGVTFAGDLDTAVRTAREAAGGRLVNVLGADVARQCLAAGVLDEVLTCVMPVLLGDGVRLFDAPGSDPVALEPVAVHRGRYSTDLRYRVRRG